MGDWLGILIVNFVLLLICFIAYSSQIFIIWPWYGSEWSTELVILLGPFNILIGLLFWNYYLCVVTDPGRVPDNWKPDLGSYDLEVKKLTGSPRFCRSCKQFKPPRSHHCRQCNRCVLRMDHHCPWVNNCIGHFNHAHFIRFLFYVDLACSYHLAMVTHRVIYIMQDKYWTPSTSEFIFMILNYVTSGPVLLLVGGFSLYHFYGLYGNTTTIEAREKDKAATLFRHGKVQEIKFPYNLGPMENLRAVLGGRIWLWCWPQPASGDGLAFPVLDGNGSDTLWPPREPTNRIYTNEEDDDPSRFVLPESPWTYQSNALNPNLRPSNSQNLRDKLAQRKKNKDASAKSPYHQDYESDSSSSSGKEYKDHQYTNDHSRPHVRRGSEGYEIRPPDRNAMLQSYLRELGEDPIEAVRYIDTEELQPDFREDQAESIEPVPTESKKHK